MLILGIDTSCDDTSASVVENGTKIISNIISSQTEIHKKYGGIVPELASRRHIEMIWPVVDEALKTVDVKLEELSGVAVCHGPGLIGSLLVGCSFAKAICYSKQIPLLAVNHLEGHIFSAFLEEPKPSFPFIALIVSGGAFTGLTALVNTGNLAGQGMMLRARHMIRYQNSSASDILAALLSRDLQMMETQSL
jgi:N6-L-threonylcarbamoyladenine synthase